MQNNEREHQTMKQHMHTRMQKQKKRTSSYETHKNEDVKRHKNK